MFERNLCNLQSEVEDISQSIAILAYTLTDEKLCETALLNKEGITTLLFSISKYLQRLGDDFSEIDNQHKKEIALLKKQSKANSKDRFVKPL